MKRLILYTALLTFIISSCTSNQQTGFHFTFLKSSATGIDFKNTITEDDSTNMFVNEYTYMGGGVGIGDFNNDGLEDVFFTGSQVSSKLYINKGSLKFEDVTQHAGVSTKGWCTGVSIVDINNDGWTDIYVCVSGKAKGDQRRNLLFVNQHNLTFKEEAAEYGLADTSYSTQAVFFDYDKDSRPDMYLLNHTLNDNRPNDIRDIKIDTNAIAADKLYHNEGIQAGVNHPVFKDVSKQAGIIEDGNGLGIAVSDVNDDGYPDVYVCNDYIRNDLLWLNNKNGTFSNCISSSIKHQSYSSMGADASDVNNDDLPDIITLDMQPETNERKKMMYSFLSQQRHELEMQKGYQPEYIHNMLQLNNGVRNVNNRSEPFFSEVSEMAGIAETDWSWSVLIADLDNDGWKDVHIANGLGRDPTNIDFLEYRHNMVVQSGLPDNDPQQRKNFMEHLAALGGVQLHNYIYKNENGFLFKDVSQQAGVTEKSISNGAAYADLDNDGDLDIVTNNINGDAFIMQNNLRNNDTSKANNYLAVKLNGDANNKDGIGAKVFAYSKNVVQMQEQYPVRGYLSSVDNRLHFGFGNNAVDSIKIIWADGNTQTIQHPSINKILIVDYKNANQKYNLSIQKQDSLFTDVTQTANINFQHKETLFYDYQFQPLIMQKYSQEGPFISSGDVNKDELEDFFIGGAFQQSGKIFMQQSNGSFVGKDLIGGVKNEEDMQSIFLDADGDGDLDLFVASGSSEFDITSSYYRPRLYINDGKGNFSLDDHAVSALVRTPAKSLAAIDFDNDGDMDIFIGGRVLLGAFPQSPRSYLLRNDHGKFTDVTKQICPALENAGMLNAAVFADVDGDKKPELIIAGDWMPIRIFKNNGTSFSEILNNNGINNLPGLWRSLNAVDVDDDGDIDLVAGNIGLNNPFHIDEKKPAELVAKDFDGNGIIEPILCYFIKNNDGKYELSSGISRDDWARQMPSIKTAFEQNGPYAKATMNEIFTQPMMENAMVLHCSETRSGWFENKGKGAFAFHPFPLQAQVAPVNATIVADINNDGIKDILLAGNDYEASVTPGAYDASYGLFLKGNNHHTFTAVSPTQSNFIIDGDVRDLKMINSKNGKIVLCAVNNAAMKAFEIKSKR